MVLAGPNGAGKGDLAGYHAINLTGQWRLIVSRQEQSVTVEAVSNHYDD